MCRGEIYVNSFFSEQAVMSGSGSALLANKISAEHARMKRKLHALLLSVTGFYAVAVGACCIS